jgi:hypothetical protein
MGASETEGAAMKSFDRLLGCLSSVTDPRRAEGKRYELRYVLLFSILAVVAGANSYRGIRTFIKAHRKRLNNAFGLHWKKPPAHTSIRSLFICISETDVENAFRQHAASLNAAKLGTTSGWGVAIDGKTLKGSFDAFTGQKAKQILSLFVTDTALLLAHIEIDDKTNEIPMAQKLLEELDVAGHLVTLDALHCQKKHSKLPPLQKRI